MRAGHYEEFFYDVHPHADTLALNSEYLTSRR